MSPPPHKDSRPAQKVEGAGLGSTMRLHATVELQHPYEHACWLRWSFLPIAKAGTDSTKGLAGKYADVFTTTVAPLAKAG